MEGIIIQKGAFNPIHRMHIRIAEDVKKRFPTFSHIMTLCKKSCDKGETSREEMLKRSELIQEAGYRVIFEDSGLFIDTIAKAREALGEDDIIVFPCGEDTIQRFFRDWDDHYSYKTNEPWKRYADYKEKFRNVIWYVSRRETQSRKYMPVVMMYLREYNNVEWSELDLDDISSTKIRSGEIKNE